MKSISMKVKPFVLALGLSSLLVSGTAFSAAVSVKTTNSTIKGAPPFIPYVHVKSSTETLQVDSTLFFDLPDATSYLFKDKWTPLDQSDIETKSAQNTAPAPGVPGVNKMGGSLMFVDLDGDKEGDRKDRKNGGKVVIEWYKMIETDPSLAGEITLGDVEANWTKLTADNDKGEYTLKLGDLNYQIAAVIMPMTATGDPDRNNKLLVPNVLEFAGQVVDPENPGGPVDPLDPGPNPEIIPPGDGGPGVEPKTGADLRLVIHTNKAYNDAYLAYKADPSGPAPDFSTVPASDIFGDNLDMNAGQGLSLKTDTVYYATVLATEIEGSTVVTDYTTDVTSEYADTLIWSYVDQDNSTPFEIDNDGEMAFRTLRNSNVAGSAGDLNGDGAETDNDGSVVDRVKDSTAILDALNLTPGADALGLNEQGFRIKFSVDDGTSE
ncbi:hypothetical protein [Thorsellia anophelis]|uniref:Uncharacterized protein n=1 Tax=Thorsellia anophelis DSM 18579 TaxID=1123402 RepID=A0A1H9YFL1_9GAMM|nr:hypothetical protein [Thorsellia anophelis]SES67783.1 hypothetical protein SAMN02583745_00238 [Thorsellia anophelis DSM 18579]